MRGARDSARVVLFVVGPPLDRVRHKGSDTFQLIFWGLEGSQPPVQLRRRDMSFVVLDEPGRRLGRGLQDVRGVQQQWLKASSSANRDVRNAGEVRRLWGAPGYRWRQKSKCWRCDEEAVVQTGSGRPNGSEMVETWWVGVEGGK